MNLELLVTIGLGLIALIVVLVAWVGPARFITLWEALPLRLRSMVNVALAAALAFGGSALIDWLAHADIPVWVKVGLTAVITPIIRQLNAADPYPNPTDPVGEHEAPALPPAGE